VFWSEALQDMIAFVLHEDHLTRVPAGLVAFTADELQYIFPEGRDGPSPESLLLIFEAKKHGGRIVGHDSSAEVAE